MHKKILDIISLVGYILRINAPVRIVPCQSITSSNSKHYVHLNFIDAYKVLPTLLAGKKYWNMARPSFMRTH